MNHWNDERDHQQHLSNLLLPDVTTEISVADHEDSVENHDDWVDPVDAYDDCSENTNNEADNLIVENSPRKRDTKHNDHRHAGKSVQHHHVVN